MAEKKKLQVFLGDLLKVGCVKGFKHFATHLRGREEMVCSVINEPTVPILLSAANSPANSFTFRGKVSLTKEPGAVLMSHKRQRRLSGYGFIDVGLPPASPSGTEDDEDENSTMFLVAGYARYNKPYVWVRSNHERLVHLSTEEATAQTQKDYPLLLSTTSEWQERDVKVWDVIAELVAICTAPTPPNPFAVDFDYFEALPFPERALASAAMSLLLQRLLASGSHSYDRRVSADLLKISQLHFRAMLFLVESNTIVAPPSPESLTPPSSSSSHHPSHPHTAGAVQRTPSHPHHPHTQTTPTRQHTGGTMAGRQGQPYPPAPQPTANEQQGFPSRMGQSGYFSTGGFR